MITRVTGTLWRGPRPADLTPIKELGVLRIINLQSGIYELIHDDPYENINTLDYGIVEHDLGCSDFLPPDEYTVARALNIINIGEPTYIHCKHGVDRTGYIIAAYRMRCQGWSYEKAKAEMMAHGFHRFPYAIWLPKLKTWEQNR